MARYQWRHLTELCNVGMVGYEGRRDDTASGIAVNLAAWLCDRAEGGEILPSPRADIAVEVFRLMDGTQGDAES